MTYIENRGFSPWQLLLGKTPTDKTACEDPDLAQRSVEVVDEVSKQCVRVNEESYKAYIEEELSLRKRRKEIRQARPWRHWAASEWCWYWRPGKHKASRLKGGVFLGPSRVLIQERETTAEAVRMKNVVWITKVLLLFDVLYSICVPFPSPRKDCATSQTQKPSISMPHNTFLDLTTQTDAPDDAWHEEITCWDPRSTRDLGNSSNFLPHQSDATSRLGPDLMPPNRLVRTDDEMSVQEPETTHVPIAHPSTSETIPSDVLVTSDNFHASHSVETSSKSVGPCGTSKTYQK